MLDYLPGMKLADLEGLLSSGFEGPRDCSYWWLVGTRIS